MESLSHHLNCLFNHLRLHPNSLRPVLHHISETLSLKFLTDDLTRSGSTKYLLYFLRSTERVLLCATISTLHTSLTEHHRSIAFIAKLKRLVYCSNPTTVINL